MGNSNVMEYSSVLRCPDHLDTPLELADDSLICKICKTRYDLLNHNGTIVPNFLTNVDLWDIGYRPHNSVVLDILSGVSSKNAIDHRGSSTLDIGCGSQPRGTVNVDCYIPEPIPPNFVLASAEKLPFKDQSFDIVTSYYNIEHLVNPVDYIRRVVDISKREVVIVTDNSDWLGDILFRILGSGRIFNTEHYYKWSVEYFSNLLKRIGIINYNVEAANLSNNIFVKLTYIFSCLPRIGVIFARDLIIRISK